MVMAWCCSMHKCMMWWLIANQWSSGEEAPPGQMQTGHRLWLSSALLYKFTQDPHRLSNSVYFVFSSVLCTSSWLLDIWIVHPTPTQLFWTMVESVARYQMRAPLISFTPSGTNHDQNCTHFHLWIKTTQVIQLFDRWFPTLYFSLPPNIAGNSP